MTLPVNSSGAIGVFDSGIGGLSIVKHLVAHLPYEDVIYFGDIARIPYGTKSVAAIKKFTQQTVEFLLAKQVKALIIACNTISAVAKETVLELAYNIPVIDVISAGAQAGLANGKRIGVIATPATINSNAYPQAIYNLMPEAQVFTKPCALLVPLIEEGWLTHKALKLIAKEYLSDMQSLNLDSLILGCTHYPLIANTLQQIIGEKIKMVDPSITACNLLAHELSRRGLNCYNDHKHQPKRRGDCKFYVTDVPLRFQEIGELFLNFPMLHLEIVEVN